MARTVRHDTPSTVGLLLRPTRVGRHQRGTGFEREEVEVAERADEREGRD